MRATLRNWFLLGIFLFSLFALAACNGDGGGTPIVPPGDQQPGDQQPGDQQPGDGQQPGPTTPTADTFSWIGNSPLAIGADRGVLANDPAGSTVSAADTATTGGGTVTVNPDGSFSYRPLDRFSGTDSFTYTVTGFSPTTVTIQIDTLAWYVDNTTAAGGNGSFTSRFNTLAAAAAEAAANDTIFVFTGVPTVPTDAGQDLGVTLKPGQKLIGQGVGLSFNDVPIASRLPNAPVISNAGFLTPQAAGDTPVIMLDAATGGNEVAGFAIRAAFNEGILALGGTGHNLHDNSFTFPRAPQQGREGIRLLSITGDNMVHGNTITGAVRDGIRLANNENLAGDVGPAIPITTVIATVTMSRNTITGSARDGIAVNLDGAGTDVTLNILTNTINNSGTEAGRVDGGIDINSLGAANVTTVISRNTISNSTDRAVGQVAAGTSSMDAFVANNKLSLSGVNLEDFRGRVDNAGATFCLELINNFNAALNGVPAGNSTFQVNNNGGAAVPPLFQYFEADNDNIAGRNPLVLADRFTLVAQGACAIPLDGAILFEANCAKCHNAVGAGLGMTVMMKELIAKDITNATRAMVDLQLAINNSMIQEFSGDGRLRLTPQELDAIAAALVAAP